MNRSLLLLIYPVKPVSSRWQEQTQLIMKYERKTLVFNPSFTKPFGTHTFYQGGGWSSRTLSYLKNRCPHEREIFCGY